MRRNVAGSTAEGDNGKEEIPHDPAVRAKESQSSLSVLARGGGRGGGDEDVALTDKEQHVQRGSREQTTHLTCNASFFGKPRRSNTNVFIKPSETLPR